MPSRTFWTATSPAISSSTASAKGSACPMALAVMMLPSRTTDLLPAKEPAGKSTSNPGKHVARWPSSRPSSAQVWGGGGADGSDRLAGGELAHQLADALIASQMGRAGHAAGQHHVVVLGEVHVVEDLVAGDAYLLGAHHVARIHDGDEGGAHALLGAGYPGGMVRYSMVSNPSAARMATAVHGAPFVRGLLRISCVIPKTPGCRGRFSTIFSVRAARA